MKFFSLIFVFFSSRVATGKEDFDRAETIHCPGGTLIHGLSISVSNSLPWQDVRTSDKLSSPFSVCIFCRTMDNVERSRNINQSNDVEYNLVHQVCVNQGDATQTVPQLFECSADDFMTGFYKNQSQLASFFSCRQFDAGEGQGHKPSLYEAKFPGNGRPSEAKQNWNSFRSDLKCGHEVGGDDADHQDHDQYLCGIRIKLSGRGQQQQQQRLAHVRKNPVVQEISSICCYGHEVIGLPRADFLSSDCSQNHQSERVALIVIGILFVILVIGIAIYAVDRFCLKIIPDFFVRHTSSKILPGKYNQNGDSNRNGSSLNTRPSTAVAQIVHPKSSDPGPTITEES